jgi:hypothetical protein
MPRRPIERIPVRERCVRCRRPAELERDLSRPFPQMSMTREEERQAREAESFGSSVVTQELREHQKRILESVVTQKLSEYVPPTCSHGFDDWTECGACTDAADLDDGLPTGGDL